jgi:hypothetical protein
MNAANWILLFLPFVGGIALYYALKRYDRTHPLTRRQDQEAPEVVARQSEVRSRKFADPMPEVFAQVTTEKPDERSASTGKSAAKTAAKPLAKAAARPAARKIAKSRKKPGSKAG